MTCTIFRNNDNEIVKVVAPNKKESQLFADILKNPSIDGDKELAVRHWVQVYMDDFKAKHGDWENDPNNFDGELDANGEPKIDILLNSSDSNIKSLKDAPTGSKNILEKDLVRESKKNIYLDSMTEVISDVNTHKDLSSIESRLESTYAKLQDVVEYQLKIIRQFEGDDKTFSTRIEELSETLDEYSDANQVKGVVHYVTSIMKEIEALKRSLDKKDKDSEDMVKVLKNYKKYLSLFNVINDIQELHDDGLKYSTEEEKIGMSALINDIKSIHNEVEREFRIITNEHLVKELSDIKYHREVEAKWRKKFETEYNEIYLNNSKRLKDLRYKKQWIVDQFRVYKSLIDKDVKKATEALIHNKAFDISYFATQLFSSLETSSSLVEVFQTELSILRDQIIEEFTPVDEAIAAKFKEHKDNNSGKYSPHSQFKNILETSSNGNVYLKGEYTTEYIDDYYKLKALKDSLSEMDAETNPEGYDKLKQEIEDLDNQMHFHDMFGNPSGVRSKYKNDLSKISKAERDLLDFFIKLSKDSSEDSLNMNPLSKKVGPVSGVIFHKLPSITKTDAERLYANGLKGIGNMAKDKIKDLKGRRADDIGYAYAKADAGGNIIKDIPIHFRGNLAEVDQSIDLFTIYKMERQNTITFKHRKNKEMLLTMMVEMVENKSYYVTKGLSMSPLLNKFAKRNKELSTQGDNSKEIVRKIKGMMDAQFYDITKNYAGEFGKYDVQKMIGFINGYTGALGMSLNYHSATVNIIGGYSQFLIHAIAGDVIKVENLRKAFKVYRKNTSDNIKDLNEGADKSFVNQVNIMFDIFSAHNIGTDSFLKDKAWKKFASLRSLTFLQDLGEHQLQSVITMAVLDSVEALDSDGQLIKTESGDMTLLDGLKINDKGALVMDDKVQYTTHSPVTRWSNGGRSEIQQLIKYKIMQTQGNYTETLQGEAMKTPVGRLVLMFRRFFVPMFLSRYRGLSNSLTEVDKIERHKKFFSSANKRFEEGSYTTTARFVFLKLLPALKQLRLGIAMQDFKKLTDYEKRNIYKVGVEAALSLTAGILASLLAGAAEEDDNELLYFLAYTLRRTESELKQFKDPKEAVRITSAPFAAMNSLGNTIDLVQTLAQPFDWGDKYKSGKRKDELKIKRTLLKMIPVIKNEDRTNREMYHYLESSFGK